LLTSLVLTLLVVPIAYDLLDTLQQRLMGRKHGTSPAIAEEA